jgi:hypothetical protein
MQLIGDMVLRVKDILRERTVARRFRGKVTVQMQDILLNFCGCVNATGLRGLS